MKRMPRPRGTRINDYIRWALRIADGIVAEYRRRSKRPGILPRSAQDLFSIINDIHQRFYSSEITVSYLKPQDEFRSELFLGMCLRSEEAGGPMVYLSPFLDQHALRLALIQESYQALFNHEPLRAVRLDAAVKNYLEFRGHGKERGHRNFDKADGATHGEVIAEIAAMETLFPYAQRVAFRKRAGSAELPQHLWSEIVSRFGVPLKWARFYMRDVILDQLRPYRAKPKKLRNTRAAAKRAKAKVSPKRAAKTKAAGKRAPKARRAPKPKRAKKAR